MKHALMTAALVALLTACGETPQTQGANKQDASPYTGTGKGFAESNWKQGDQGSWESQMKARNQYGQNDYSRMN